MNNSFCSLSATLSRAARAAAALAIAFLAANASADRTITISEMTSSKATLIFGPTDGETYYLYMAYGTADGGNSGAGWDNFDEIGARWKVLPPPTTMQSASLTALTLSSK